MLPGRKGSSAARWDHQSKVAAKRASEDAKSDRDFGQRRKQPKMFRAGLYARVSTNDQQTLPMQSRSMREYRVVYRALGSVGLAEMLVFLGVLMVGFAYAWDNGEARAIYRPH